MTTIDEQALHQGLATEQRELREAIAEDERTLQDGDDERVAAALELRRSQLRKVEHALERHEQGTWRECEQCGATVTDEQLRTVPTATHCTECAKDEVYWGDTRTISLDELGLDNQ